MIFVDDEAIVRDGIAGCVPWDEVGFELSAVFEHGLAALEYIEENPVDVVLSDINMPRMSGLELSRVLGERFPSIIVILLTGYDDFEYAQTAIRNQVREFILKPITQSELSSVLKTIRVELEQEREKQRQQELLRAKLEQSFPLLKERFLCRLVSDSSSLNTMAGEIEYYQWKNLSALYQILVMSVPQSWSELDRFSMGEFLKEQVNEEDEVFFSRSNDLIILIQSAEEEDLKKRVQYLIDATFEYSVDQNIKMPSLGCGEVVDQLHMLERSYNGACSAVDYSRSLGLNQIVTVEEIRNREAPSPERLNQYNTDILEQLKEGLFNDCLQTLQSLKEYLEGHYQTPQELTVIFLLLYSRIISFLRDLDISLLQNDFPKLESYMFESLETAEQYLISFIKQIDIKIRQRRNDALHSRIDRAKTIIQERYMEKDFSLQDICRDLFLSTSQFSLLFKEGTDQTFVEYLTNIRMREAKKLLLSTDLKSYEIADKVGYADPRYFTIIFKKISGMTAMEYRRTRDS